MNILIDHSIHLTLVREQIHVYGMLESDGFISIMERRAKNKSAHSFTLLSVIFRDEV